MPRSRSSEPEFVAAARLKTRFGILEGGLLKFVACGLVRVLVFPGRTPRYSVADVEKCLKTQPHRIKTTAKIGSARKVTA